MIISQTECYTMGEMSMGNTLAITLWKMLKVGALTNDEKKKGEIENIKNIMKKEKNDC